MATATITITDTDLAQGLCDFDLAVTGASSNEDGFYSAAHLFGLFLHQALKTHELAAQVFAFADKLIEGNQEAVGHILNNDNRSTIIGGGVAA